MVGALAIGSFACNDLEEYNPSGATADAVWSTPEGFLTVVNASYSDLRQFYGKEDGIFMFESGTDLWINENLGGYARQITKYEGLTPLDGNPNKKFWQLLWQSINHANAGINRIDDAGFTSQQERNRRLGELRFLRAFYYWHLVETYGGVMLRTQETQSVELTAQRSPVEAFYEVIIEDLKFAAENLPLQSGWGGEYSRASKKAAMGMLAKAYLSRAYYSTGAERNQYFELARDAARNVITKSKSGMALVGGAAGTGELDVELWSTYADVWAPKNNKKNKEALFVVSNTQNNASLNFDNNANRLHLWYMPQYANLSTALKRSLEYGNDSERRLMPTLALLDFFDETKDSRYKGSFREAWIANATDPFTGQPWEWTQARINQYNKDQSLLGKKIIPGQDTALYITKKAITNEAMRPYIVIDRNDTYHAATTGAVKDGRYFVQLKKFDDPLTRTDPNLKPGYNDVIVIRLAEMYLIAAEAELQLGNPTEAARYINVLRTRAALPGKVEDMQITAGDVDVNFILDERARELAGEHTRWYDLKRTGKLVERVREYNPDITLIQPHHVLRPVPQVELDALLNGQEFGQNPGYN